MACWVFLLPQTFPVGARATAGRKPTAFGCLEASATMRTEIMVTLNDLWEGGISGPSPVFSLASGTYTGTQSVSISMPPLGRRFITRQMESQPTTGSNRYVGPVQVAFTGETLQAVAVVPGYLPSFVTSRSTRCSSLQRHKQPRPCLRREPETIQRHNL